MNDSSDEVLAGISPAQIRVLLNILCTSTWRSRAFVEGRFRERARNFGETLVFLQRLGWVHAKGPELHIADAWKERLCVDGFDDDAVALLDALLDSPGQHQREFARYLVNFQGVDGLDTCPSRGELNLADAPARNFLMDLGAVRHDPSRREYVLEPLFYGAYVWAVARRCPGTHTELLQNIGDRHWLGHDAEIAVVEFEQNRLGPRWVNRIHHVSDDYPTAPYDIKSLTVTECRPTSRYIEVKAISAVDPEFHWSASEIEAARLLRLEYYLYLVPVLASSKLDLEHLHIIADPYSEIYCQPSVWEKLPTSFLCRPARVQIS